MDYQNRFGEEKWRWVCCLSFLVSLPISVHKSSTYIGIPTFLNMCERSWHLSSNNYRTMGMVSIHRLSYCYWDKIPWSTAAWGGRKEVSFTHQSIQQPIIQSSSFRVRWGPGLSKRCRGSKRVLFTGLLLVSCSACFILGARATSPGGDPPIMDWVLPHWSLIWKTMLWRNFRSRGSPSLRTLAPAKLT